jgi:hypothetical protein
MGRDKSAALRQKSGGDGGSAQTKALTGQARNSVLITHHQGQQRIIPLFINYLSTSLRRSLPYFTMVRTSLP